MDLILLFAAKRVDKHGITLVHITYPPLGITTRAERCVPCNNLVSKRCHRNFETLGANILICYSDNTEVNMYGPYSYQYAVGVFHLE